MLINNSQYKEDFKIVHSVFLAFYIKIFIVIYHIKMIFTVLERCLKFLVSDSYSRSSKWENAGLCLTGLHSPIRPLMWVTKIQNKQIRRTMCFVDWILTWPQLT